MKNSKWIIAILIFIPTFFLLTAMHDANESSPLKKNYYHTIVFQPVEPFMANGLQWLAEAQFDNGGWGAGQHTSQSVRDPRAVKIDPGTTAFAAMALLRAGNTLDEGIYSANVNNALFYLLELVEESPVEGPNITSVTGTQPQRKLGANIDASLTSQFLTRVLQFTKNDRALEARVERALDKCIKKIESGQNADGSFKGGSWAGVLQSTMADNALELAQSMGRDVDSKKLAKSKAYQRGNVNTKSGRISTESSAGVSFYAGSSNGRAVAKDARKAQLIIDEAIEKGELEKDAEVTEDNLKAIGYDDEEAKNFTYAKEANDLNISRIDDDAYLSGFGNNGGEEFLSYMMTSESLVIAGGDAWDKWNTKMFKRLAKIQNANGSWSGHHCITSPVFCTAAVILTLTSENDIALLTKEVDTTSSN